ncbi:MAG TPA: DUF3828 domain-containing protein [Rhizomicrobium sp.]|jgi:hypothetical protein
MRKVWMVAVIGLLSVLAAPEGGAATNIPDPAAFVETLFARMAHATANKPYTPPEDIYSPRLAALTALDKREAGGEVGRLDFDIWTGAQDWQLSNVKIRSVDVESTKDRKIVIATFKNAGKSHELHYYFERGKTGWQLDDVRSVDAGAGEQWTLSVVLKYGWADTPQ